jgi:hypothetical protein
VEVLALGARFSDEMLAALTAEQQQALAQAVCVQALWLLELEDEWLGGSDIASLP